MGSGAAKMSIMSARAATGAIPIAGDLATKQDIAALKFAVLSFGPVIIGLPVKLVFFS